MDVPAITLINTLNNINDKPLFCPAIYDLKAKLANCIPSDQARNADEIYIALEQEIEILGLKIVTVVFDSFASPPLVSPEIYHDLIFTFHKELFDCMKDHNIQIRPLIIGGNSIPLLKYLADTGANSFLLDFSFDFHNLDFIRLDK